MNDVETAREIWTDIMEQVRKLPPETFALAITGLPTAIRRQLTGAHPTIKKALELLGDTIPAERNQEFTAENEFRVVFGYNPNTLLEAAWEQLQPWDKKKPNRRAVPKTPKDVSPWDNNKLGQVPCNHFVAEHLGAQMLGGDNWEHKVGGFRYESETQTVPNIRKDCSGGGRIQITLAAAPDAAEQTTDQIREAISATLQQYGGLWGLKSNGTKTYAKAS